ncbi:MAG: tetratricopeptide repeat protein [Gemmatimonadota bacterium]|nr:MAG: tetratricopeptide repeat protein [Gemmatimonadota bacterium]
MNSEIDTLLGKLDAHPGSLVFARVAGAYLKADKVNQAIQICEQGLSHHSDYATGHMIMAACYFKVGLLEQAIRECEHVLELDPEHMAVLYHLGDIYVEQKNFEQALNAYQRVLQLDPYNEAARERIVQLQHHTGDNVTKLTDDRAGDEGRTSPEASIVTPTLADIYASQGLTERAITVLRRLLERAPDKEDVLHRITELEEELKMTKTGGDHGNDG